MNRKLGYLYTTIMAIYFLISGISVLFDVPRKLNRIDLSALNTDGEVAFILIYSGLMVGIGVACIAMQIISKSWFYSALLSTIIISSFIVFRLIGSSLVGTLSELQTKFLVFEFFEVMIGVLLLRKHQFKKT